jgi:hypothetical protein
MSDRWRQLQKYFQLQRLARQRIQRAGTATLKQEESSAATSHKLQRSRRPGTIQIILEGEFVGESADGGGRRVFRSWQHGDKRVLGTLRIIPPGSAI